MTRSLDVEFGPAVVGVLVALSGALFLLTPVVARSPTGIAVNTVRLSATVLALAFALGTVVFARRGHRAFALAHGVFAVAWTLLVVGPLVGNGDVFLAGVVVLVAGSGFLLSQRR